MSNLVLARPQVITTAQKLVVRGTNFIAKQSPIILAGTAIVGVCTTAYLATKAGIQADELIKEAEYEKQRVEGPETRLTPMETIQTTWKAYVPTVISGGLTIGAIIASSAISQRRQAALAGLYALSETALKEYQDKIEQKYGTKDAQKVRDEINEDRVNNTGIPPWDVDALPQGEVLCFDKITGRYFRSSAQKIHFAVAEILKMIYGGDMCASLNEFYGILDNKDLPQCSIGDDIGWSIDCPPDVYLSSCLTSDMKPCLVLDWSNSHGPTYRYRDI